MCPFYCFNFLTVIVAFIIPITIIVFRHHRLHSLLFLMVSSSLYVSHMFVTRVLSSLVFKVVLLWN